jgi:pyruvate kinase
MTDNRRPTRAEATDVANAILDGTDCVMLSGESAMGKYPVDAVAMLGKIAASVEARRPTIAVKELYRGIDIAGKVRPEHLIAIGVEACLEYTSPAAVFVPTRSGAAARSIARFRFPVWTIAVSSQAATCQALQFSSGVYAIHELDHPEQWKEYVNRRLGELGIAGNFVVLTEGPSARHPEANNRMEIIDLRPKPKS